MQIRPPGSDKVNILLVDDQPAKLLTYEVILASLGENLIKANSGLEALDHLLRTEITVILMDVSMPGLDGFELAEIIRAHPRYARTAIIFVSAVHQSDIDRLKGYDSGAVDYLSVPVVPELLRAKVRVFTELYRKTVEAERLTRELEQRVQERTADLEMAIACQMALAERLREADRRKDEFLAQLAHELRNPLAAVQNAINIMQLRDIDDRELKWGRDVIHRQSRQLNRLVDDLLEVSRITHGKITLRKERVSLAHIIEDALEMSRPQISAHRHDLRLELPKIPVHLYGDTMRLTQVLVNLINNAAKYQQPGGVIWLSVSRDDEVARISVRDQGIGMTPELIEHVFDLFTQGDCTTDGAHGGLGIGLSLVKSLVELHGGKVYVRSDGLGRGSEFVVELPTAVGEALASEQEVSLLPRHARLQAATQ